MPGKTFYTADTLSRAPINELSCDASYTPEEIEKFVQEIIATFSASSDCLNIYCKAQAEDSICSKLIQYCKSEWPTRNQLTREIKEYWKYRGKLTLSGNLLLFQTKIVVQAMRQMTLEKIHEGHQGIQRCRMRALCSVWWPGMYKEVEVFVQSCPTCQKTVIPPKEPLITTPLPSYPWECI